MGETTKIEWADHTFNPWIGCTKISPACDGCYAEALMDKRLGRVEWGAPGQGVGTRKRTSAGNWHQPVRWNAAAEKAGTRPFVFCASLADVFDNQVLEEWRRDLFDLIHKTPRLVWLLLTKRPQNIVTMAEACGGLPANAAIGATCEDQERADKNVPALLDAKAKLSPAFAFLSCEPLLGAIDLHEWLLGFSAGNPAKCVRCGKGHGFTRCPNYGRVSRQRSDYTGGPIVCHDFVHDPQSAGGLDWIITGGETDQGGHKARPTHPDWFRSIRNQCAAAGVAYHHKQNGEWVSAKDYPGDMPIGHVFDDGFQMIKLGKTRTGRLLDGKTHDGFPAIRSA